MRENKNCKEEEDFLFNCSVFLKMTARNISSSAPFHQGYGVWVPGASKNYFHMDLGRAPD